MTPGRRGSEELRDLVRETASPNPQGKRPRESHVSYLDVDIRLRRGDLELDLFVILAVFLVATAVLLAVVVSRVVSAVVLLCNTFRSRITLSAAGSALPRPSSLFDRSLRP